MRGRTRLWSSAITGAALCASAVFARPQGHTFAPHELTRGDAPQGIEWPDGLLYVLTAEDDGAVLRIEPR